MATGNLVLAVSFSPTLGDGTALGTVPDTATVTITGAHGIRYNYNVTTSDTTLDLGSISTIGFIRVRNRAQIVTVTTPGTPVITQGGTPAGTTDTYKIVAVQSDGTYSAASGAGTTSTAAATLNNTNYNIITWTAATGAVDHYDVYRTVAGGTPNTTGKIGSVASSILTLNDTGLAGDSSSAPSVAADNQLLYSDTNADYPLNLFGGEFSALRWNTAAIHVKANTRTIPIEVTLLDN